MATTFDRAQPLGGLPPKHIMEGEYNPTIKDLITKEDALETIKRAFEDNLKKNANLVRISAPFCSALCTKDVRIQRQPQRYRTSCNLCSS